MTFTGIHVVAGDVIQIATTGTLRGGPVSLGFGFFDANGAPADAPQTSAGPHSGGDFPIITNPPANIFSLIGTIRDPLTGTPNQWIFFGTSNTATAFASGELVLLVHDALYRFDYPAAYLDNVGQFEATITINPCSGTLAEKAACLAQRLVGAPYLWGGKGWDLVRHAFATVEEISNSGYHYWNPNHMMTEFFFGIDCSGLVLWSYNTASGPLGPGQPLAPNPIEYWNADGQYRFNTTPVTGADLIPGDLLFFDAVSPFGATVQVGTIDHVAMYVGDGQVVEALGSGRGVTTSPLSARIGHPSFRDYGRVIAATLDLSFVSQSPVSLIVTDPTGNRIDVTTLIQTPEEALREVPGELYYSEYDTNNDGELDDVVQSPHLKPGVYLIQVVPDPGASSSDTYTLLAKTGSQTLVLASGSSVGSIPPLGYGVLSRGGAIVELVPAGLDIQPQSDRNIINQRGIVRVALLGSDIFDVTDVDVATVAFGPSGAPPSLPRPHFQDVNKDGLMDLVSHFREELTGLRPSDRVACLNGATKSGMPIRGCDAVQVLP